MLWVSLHLACTGIILRPIVNGTGLHRGAGRLTVVADGWPSAPCGCSMRTRWKAFNIVTHRVMLGK